MLVYSLYIMLVRTAFGTEHTLDVSTHTHLQRRFYTHTNTQFDTFPSFRHSKTNCSSFSEIEVDLVALLVSWSRECVSGCDWMNIYVPVTTGQTLYPLLRYDFVPSITFSILTIFTFAHTWKCKMCECVFVCVQASECMKVYTTIWWRGRRCCIYRCISCQMKFRLPSNLFHRKPQLKYLPNNRFGFQWMDVWVRVSVNRYELLWCHPSSSQRLCESRSVCDHSRIDVFSSLCTSFIPAVNVYMASGEFSFGGY